MITCTLEKHRTADRYFARTRKMGRVGFKQIAKEISRNCSAKPSDVNLVLTELVDVMHHHLLDGHEITIPDIGSFHIGVTSKSVENPADFDPHQHIRDFHIKFRPTAHRDSITWRLDKPLLNGVKVKTL